ncbi:MAG: 6-bladed beta-propeller [Bacteroidales bacterium]|nr:6-bladed beta-propeller [Bacteroidales bacterium]
MKTQTALIISVLSLLSCFSCTIHENSKKEKISFPITIHLNLTKVNSDSMNLSEIAEKVEYIPLETSDSSLLRDIYNLGVTNEYYFIKNDWDILKYDKNGKFVNTLSRSGKGPEEAMARSFAIDGEGKM